MTDQKKPFSLKTISRYVFGITVLVMLFMIFNYLKLIEYNLRSANIKEDRQTAIRLSDTDDSFLGEVNAPIELLLFSDFECDYCRNFEQEVLPLLQENWIKTGKVKFVFKHFPLSFHPGGVLAAQVSEYAKSKGKFWEMHDYLFQGQSLEGQLATVNAFSTTIGLDSLVLNESLTNGTFLGTVGSDQQHAQIANITGTPTLVINNRVYEGYRTYEELNAILERESEETK